jgi:glycosyltransferase XagB
MHHAKTETPMRVVHVTGSLVASRVAELRKELFGQITSAHPRLVVDLSQVEWLDSNGIALLISARARAQAADGDIAFVQSRHEAVRWHLRLTRTDEILGCHPTLEEASQSLPVPVRPFAISFHDVTLSETDCLLVLRMLATRGLTPAQASAALETHRRHGSNIWSILLAAGHITAREYAQHVARVTQTDYASSLLDTDEFACDKTFVTQFDPADLLRALCCPVHCLENLVLVLAVDPKAPEVHEIVARVVPGAEVVAVAVTDYDIRMRIDQIFRDRLLDTAINSLKSLRPDLSAARVFTRAQIVTLACTGALLTAALLIVPRVALVSSLIMLTLFYSAAIVFKVAIGLAGMTNKRPKSNRAPSDIPATELPIYSILVPVYREPQVIPTLLQALARLDYPPEKLDVLLLFEEDDAETIAKAKAARPPHYFRFVYVPKSLPRTKPKACNYGLQFCRGEFVTIYDAEDIPDPGQLKEAVWAFRHGGSDLVCVQAALNYFNSSENVLTRMFTLEYSYWFDHLLPGLDRLGLPIPLGGTSNHFPVARLRKLGAWDPFNVTEDADLGIRATVENFRVGVIRSTTYEEANREIRNWIRQRSRWIKGYMQTWLVHNRRPVSLLRAIGLKRWLSYQFFIGGTCLTFLANPVVWLVFALSLLFPTWIDAFDAGWMRNLALATFVGGNGLAIVQSAIGVSRRDLTHLLPYALLTPLYWCLHSIAAYIALWQLFTNPFYWEKTTHGLTSVEVPAMATLSSQTP